MGTLVHGDMAGALALLASSACFYWEAADTMPFLRAWRLHAATACSFNRESHQDIDVPTLQARKCLQVCPRQRGPLPACLRFDINIPFACLRCWRKWMPYRRSCETPKGRRGHGMLRMSAATYISSTLPGAGQSGRAGRSGNRLIFAFHVEHIDPDFSTGRFFGGSKARRSACGQKPVRSSLAASSQT